MKEEKNLDEALEKQQSQSEPMLDKKALLNLIWKDIAKQLECHKKQCQQLSKNIGSRILESMETQGMKLTSPYARLLFKESALILKDSLKGDKKITFSEALQQATAYLEKIIATYFDELVQSNQLEKLMQILGEDLLKTIRLYEIKRFREKPNFQQDEKTKNDDVVNNAVNKMKQKNNNQKIAKANSGLFVDAL